MSEGWWLRLQADHDTRKAKVALAKELAKIKPLKFIGSDKGRGDVARNTKALLRKHFRGK